MFRTLIYPSSGACDCVDELPHRSSCSQFVVCWSFCCGWYLVVFVLQAEAFASAYKTNTTQNKPHQRSNTQRTENKTTDVVIHQHSRKLLKMDILMSETCGAHKTWNKIASDIKLVFHSSTITMMHGPINIRLEFILNLLTTVSSKLGCELWVSTFGFVEGWESRGTVYSLLVYTMHTFSFSLHIGKISEKISYFCLWKKLVKETLFLPRLKLTWISLLFEDKVPTAL
jgi:hypothetical protein